jgi:Protein of unknown function (DUF2628)
MSVYTVHQPPLRGTERAPDPDRFIFVRDGFSIWAFLFSALWMLWHRLWLVLAIYVAVTAAIEMGLRYIGVSSAILAIVGLLISLLIGFEGATLQRFTLGRRGWKHIGVVGGDDMEDAERRFFDSWVRAARAGPTVMPSSTLSPPSSAPPLTDVIGLFPEPGANR